MKYEVGDEILVLLSNEEGRVVEIINDKMVMIEIRGVKFPAYMDQIDFPYFKRFTKTKIVEEKKPPKTYIDNIPKENVRPNQIKVADGVWLVLIPKFSFDEFDDEVVELLKIHLVNKMDKAYSFDYSLSYQNVTDFALKGSLPSFNDFYLHDIPFHAINDSPSFNINFELSVLDKHKVSNHSVVLKLKPKQIFQKVEEMKEKNLPTIAYKLFDSFPDQKIVEKSVASPLKTDKAKKYDLTNIRQHIEPAMDVVDLHIERLTNEWAHLSNFEILTIQLEAFEKWYGLAVFHGLSTFIVIHGVGKGKLREEIHEILKTKKEVKSFVNQYNHRFGYGATEIYFN